MSAQSRMRFRGIVAPAVARLVFPILLAVLPSQAVLRSLADDRFLGSRHAGWPTVLTPVAGFHDLGGDWQVVDDILHVNGGSGPKLIYDHAELNRRYTTTTEHILNSLKNRHAWSLILSRRI